MSKEQKSNSHEFVKDLCKGLSDDELQEAEQRLQEYILLVKGICDRYEMEGKELPAFDDSE